MTRHVPIEERDLTKLPKWAQSEIGRLQRDLKSAKDKLREGPEDSNTFADPYIDPRPLGMDANIEFRVGAEDDGRDYYHVRLKERHNGERQLEIYYNGGPLGNSISVIPSASNVVFIRPSSY